MARTSTAEDWRVYYQRTGERPPRETLLQALASFEAEDAVGTAVDLGCGGGRDSIELLRRGWSVLAIDAQDSAIETLLARPELNQFGCRPRTEVSRFEAARWETADLVNSSFALPLCPKADFLAMWQRIFDSLRPGGRFAGQVYGVRDQWFGDPTNTHFTQSEIDDLLLPYEVELCRVEETDSVTPRGTAKHWHIYHIVARKPAAM